MREYTMGIFPTKHFLERISTRIIDLAPIADIYTKAKNAKVGTKLIGENQNSRIVAIKVALDEILLLTAHVKTWKKRNMKDFKRTYVILRYSEMFLQKIAKKGVDLSAIVDVFLNASHAKTGTDIIGENKTTKIIAHKTSCVKIVLITVYKKTTSEERLQEEETDLNQ